jgi:hypothetical protein
VWRRPWMSLMPTRLDSSPPLMQPAHRDWSARYCPLPDSIYEGLGQLGRAKLADPYTESDERRARVRIAAVGSCKTLTMGSNPIVASGQLQQAPGNTYPLVACIHAASPCLMSATPRCWATTMSTPSTDGE